MLEGHITNGIDVTHPQVAGSGGQRAITGFLFQILRGAQVGLDVSARIVADDSGDATTMTLMLEPSNGGDHRLDLPTHSIIEQVKFRAAHRRWSPGDVGREVLPDLLRAAKPGTAQRFRLVTSHADGLDALGDFLEHRRAGGEASLRWGQERFGIAAFTSRLAASASVEPDGANFIHLLDNFDIEVVNVTNAEHEIDVLLEPMLAPDAVVANKRHELISRMLEAAGTGRTLTAGELLGLVSTDALRRLQHAQSLPALLRRRLEHDCSALSYCAAHQARIEPPPAEGWLCVLSGESGQSKTWSLCQAALKHAQSGELAIAFRSPHSMSAFVEAISERVWLPAYGAHAPLVVIARKLKPSLAVVDSCWLTVFLDDLQDLALAQDLARTDWKDLGIRLVISAQPRITNAIRIEMGDAAVTPIDSFTSAELRRYLRSHGREAPLETMPDDVFELLQKPIHARIFGQLPPRTSWVGVTEYELFRAYWDYSTTQARDQVDHYDDRIALIALAGALVGEAPLYPWTLYDLDGAGLGVDALRRLEAVGLLRRADADEVVFASDRMLNWAVAEHLAQRIVRENWTPLEAEAALHRIDPEHAGNDGTVRRRLGYVMLDTLWLLLRTRPPGFVADLIFAHIGRKNHEWRGEPLWSDTLGTLGAALLPVIELLGARDYDEDRGYDIPRYLHFGIIAAAEADRDAAAQSIGRLLDGNDQERSIGLKAAAQVAVSEHLARLWSIHVERIRARAEAMASQSATRRFSATVVAHDQSIAAVKAAIATAPDLLERKIAATTEADELNGLVWLMLDASVIDPIRAQEMWTRLSAHLFATLPADSTGLIEALNTFGEVDHRAWLDAVPRDQRREAMHDRVLRTRAHLDPDKAFAQLRARDDDYPWSASNWWLRTLAHKDPEQLAASVRENADKGDHPLTDVLLTYTNDPALIDAKTLEWVLDASAEALRDFNDKNAAAPGQELGRNRHILDFLIKLTEPWQYDALARRAGTAFEREVVRLACARAGRRSRDRDHEGMACERILAVVAGDGYDALVVAELARDNAFGREDGYNAAHWTETEAVQQALRASPAEDGNDGYSQVIRMQSLAIHQCDDALEAMVRAGAPIFVHAAHMRGEDSRPTAKLRARVEALIARGDPEDLRVASRLAGFLRDADEARVLVPAFLDAATPEPTRRSMIGTFRAHAFYDPACLPFVRPMFEGRIDEDAQFVAGYLAAYGDAEARTAVVMWVNTLDLGVFSPSQHRYLLPLLNHEDSRGAVRAFIERSRDRGHLPRDGADLQLLAEAGDTAAHEALIRAAYRSPQAFINPTVAGIRYLAKTDSDEAFFAATRLLVRHGAPAAIELLLEIDQARALGVLLARYHDADTTILRAEIGRRLRLYVDRNKLAQWFEDLSRSSSDRDQWAAVELAAWAPADLALPWLDAIADTAPAAALREAAHCSLRSRERERAAIGHLQAMAHSAKPLKWARLNTIIECVDPYVLARPGDPASLQAFLVTSPTEFEVEAQRLHDRRRQAWKREAENADRGR